MINQRIADSLPASFYVSWSALRELILSVKALHQLNAKLVDIWLLAKDDQRLIETIPPDLGQKGQYRVNLIELGPDKPDIDFDLRKFSS